MSLKKLITGYAAYNLWANETMVAWLKTKPAGLLDTPVPSSFPGIPATLHHIRDCEHFWGNVIAADHKTESDLQEDSLLTALIATSHRLRCLVSGYSEAELAEEVVLETPWVSGRLPRYEFVQHVVTHSTYHRGQVVTIGRALGFTDAPMTDYNFYNMARELVSA